MSIQGVAVILAPSETVVHGSEHIALVTDEDGSEDAARQRLMNAFARTVLGPPFHDIDRNDAWHLWQIAEKNGFRILVKDTLPVIFEAS